jgi:hypothetical protein
MLSELESKSLNVLNTKFFNLKSNNNDVKSHCDNIQLNMVELYRKFQDPGNVDRIVDVQRDVNEIQRHMKDNVKNIMQNLDSAEQLEKHSEKIKLMGENYKKNAEDLNKVTRWGNWKLNLAIGGIGGSLLGGLVYMFMK